MKIPKIVAVSAAIGAGLPLLLLLMSVSLYRAGVELPPTLDHMLFIAKVVIWPGGFPFMAMTDGITMKPGAYIELLLFWLGTNVALYGLIAAVVVAIIPSLRRS